MGDTVNLRTKMRTARGLGSAKGGVKHWWLQRITAVALVPLCMWFMIALLQAAMFPAPDMVAEWLGSPVMVIAMVLMVVALFMHAWLGLQVIIEDYAHVPAIKYTLLIANTFGCFSLALICLLSIIRLHLLDFGAY